MEEVRCNLCGSLEARLLFRARDLRFKNEGVFNLVQCQQCGLVYLNPRPTKVGMARYYQHYHDYAINDAWLERRQLERLREVERRREAGRLLDVGCGRGEFLRVARDRGWQCFGVEISPQASDEARRKGLDVATGRFEDVDYPDSFFDVVTIYHVLEHLHDPREALSKAYQLLKSGGLLVVAVPNFDSLQAGLFRQRWYHLDAPRHLYHFAPHTLKMLLHETGFKVLETRWFSVEGDWIGIAGGIHPKLVPGILLGGTISIVLNLLTVPMYYAFQVLAFAESRVRRGGTFELYSVKRRISGRNANYKP
jgi:SAM-dependent methyltransferase